MQGICGGDGNGCVRCTEIAAMKLPYSDPRRLALSERRNRFLYGDVNVHVSDPGDVVSG